MPDSTDLYSPKIACWDTRSTEKLKVLPSGMRNLSVSAREALKSLIKLGYGRFQFYGMVWYGMVWYGIVCAILHGILWHNMQRRAVWYGMVLCGVLS